MDDTEYVIVTRVKPNYETVRDADFVAISKDRGDFYINKSRNTLHGEKLPVKEMLTIVEEFVSE